QWGTAFENGGDVPLLEHDVSPWRDWFNAQGRSRCGRQQAVFNDAGLLIRAAEQGFGIALAKKLLVQDAIDAGRLVALAAPCRLSEDDVYLVWPQTAGLTPAITRLLQWLQQQLAAV
ncbi:LysR substrate-binding domain-containing protein, partial [Serratia marcescens]